MKRPLIAAVAAITVLVAGCGDDSESADTTAAPASDSSVAGSDTSVVDTPAGFDIASVEVNAEAQTCAAGKTVTADVLTIATGEPAFPPYVINDATPEDGQGFEAAVAMSVAKVMGFEGDSVTWTRTAFDAAVAPGPKDFDFNLQQYTITDERAEVVTFSQGYYSASQAVFGFETSAAAGATTIADLKALKIGVAAGTTSVTYVEEVIAPEQEILIFNDNAAAKAALESNQIDAVVADLPTALFITAVEIEGTTVFGQIEGSGTDQFGLLMAKDSPIAPCVDLALTALKDSGQLDQITQAWMSDYVEAPVISQS
jgi:polar amino acid transport system substrate-binding protein